MSDFVNVRRVHVDNIMLVSFHSIYISCLTEYIYIEPPVRSEHEQMVSEVQRQGDTGYTED